MDSKSLKDKKLFLLDMDGTIYLGDKLFEHSLDFLEYINANGGKYIFITNNSSKSIYDYIKKLNSFSIKAGPANFMTSSQATIILLQQKYRNKNIYVLGTESFKKELTEAGLNIKDKVNNNIDCLLVGYDTELNYSKLIDACKILNRDVIYLATNPDLVCPTTFGFIPDCGSICKMLETATGKTPQYIGKPHPTMIELAMQSNGSTKEETIVVGDRLYTDIACGKNAGVSTAVVLTGETTHDLLKKTKFYPDYIFEDIGGLYKALLE